MVFKRRNRRSLMENAREFVYPTGGFRRATQYIVHRMRRLPDKPHKIARGVFAGTFVNFPPIFGVQALSAIALAWVMRGNILAAVLCTFLSNPITTPIIAVGSLELGYWMLGRDESLTFLSIVAAFGDAGGELWRNFKAMFTDAPTEWGSLAEFWRRVYFPYLVGSIIPGLIISTMAYYITIPLANAYQKLRDKKLRDRIDARRKSKAAPPAATPGADGTPD
ncbi:DUF2062 domain-containing protein [Fertoebacter nigrum]|uniref:DUF2062 domain-containing protein n=2 Tax=Fertoeibacter niger TaxID=2656921 RepID=A0A8X8H3M1_9RHOB|nr:DUF2062 domain-containing protein [Fertoeibacter niger]